MKITSKEHLKKPVIPDARSASRNPDLLLDSRLRGNDSKGKGALNRQRQLPCLVLFAATLLPTVAVAEEELGRLFYTPEQRLQIDRLKNRPGQIGTTIGNTISINGIVQRRGGGGEGSVVWINGVPQSRESADGLLAGRDIAPDAASVKVPGASKAVRLKVGQTLDLNSGTVKNISVAPVAGKDTPVENEQARPAGRAGQVDAPAQQPVQGSKDKVVSPYGKTE